MGTRISLRTCLAYSATDHSGHAKHRVCLMAARRLHRMLVVSFLDHSTHPTFPSTGLLRSVSTQTPPHQDLSHYCLPESWKDYFKFTVSFLPTKIKLKFTTCAIIAGVSWDLREKDRDTLTALRFKCFLTLPHCFQTHSSFRNGTLSTASPRMPSCLGKEIHPCPMAISFLPTAFPPSTLLPPHS